MKEEYKKVSCDLYDRLESYAIQQKSILIHYFDPAGFGVIEDEIIIKTLETKNKEEFLVAASGLRLRLDKIVSLTEV